MANQNLLKFIDTVESPQHIAFFFNDPEYARVLEFQFLKNGLKKGEQCMYATDDDPFVIISKMSHYGINVETYLKNNMLHVYQIPDPKNDPAGIVASCKNTAKKILSNLTPPFRVVGRIVPDVSTVEGIAAQLEIEQSTQENFDSFEGMIMCRYDLSKIEPKGRKKWIQSLYEKHDIIIYEQGFEEGAVLSVR
ncbi:MAG: hypothetical protein E6K91_07220 [Thaumarchaeota archaeon]|nr:MAG: hypothetical protein E6K91_07220 [Nitrososphaerota archaeon]